MTAEVTKTLKAHELLRRQYAELDSLMFSGKQYAEMGIRNALFKYEQDIWLDRNPSAPYAPLESEKIFSYEVASDGHVIVPLPELEKGVWYHRESQPAAVGQGFGPLAFQMDNIVEVFDRDEGYIENVHAMSVNWEHVTKYRLFESIEDIEELGMF